MRAVLAASTALTQHFEGLALVAYADGAEWADGYGHDGVAPGTVITAAIADEQLAADQAIAGARVVRLLGRDVVNGLTDGQWGAIVDFSYNAGVEPDLPIWDHIRTGQLALVPEDLAERVFNRQGLALAGLILRRSAEAEIWNGAASFTPPTPADVQAARAKAAALNAPPTEGP